MTDPQQLDGILALQVSVAWAGEGRSQPRRLGWWQTDLVDADGGGDLLARLLPRTHAWAKLHAVREAARRVDELARRRSGAPDRLVTLFQLGFDLDELLAERLTHHQRHQAIPADVLGPRLVIEKAFDVAGFEQFVRQIAPAPRVESAPEGRLLPGVPPADPLERVPSRRSGPTSRSGSASSRRCLRIASASSRRRCPVGSSRR